MKKITMGMKDPIDKFPQRKEGQLNVYMHISENSGVGYYRQYLPAVKLRDHGLANVLISDFRFGEGDHVEPDMKQLFSIMRWADVVVVGRKDVGEFYAQWGGIREFFNIPIIMDTDDNVQFVRPQNPGYQGYFPGAEALEWNKHAIARVFDAITVSTKDLKEFYSKKNPRIYLLPNNLDMKEWGSHEKKGWDDGFTRMAFIASAAHTEGVQIVRDPVVDILRKHPKVKFYITHIYQRFFADYPDIKDRVELVPWIKLQDWPKAMKELGFDIGLAPLADNMFNRAKSNLRWMEYSACKMASIVSPVKAYDCVKDNVTGIIAKERSEWYNGMEKLITDEKFRKEIAENAHKDVLDNYDIDKNVGVWEKTYREVYEKFHYFFGKKKEFEFLAKGKYRQLKQ